MESYQTSHVTIIYEEDTHILSLTWLGFTPSQEYHDALENALEMMKKHQCKSWIFDQRKIEVISPQDQKWVTENWTPRVIQAVGKNAKSAVILAKNIFGELSIKNLVDTTRDNVNTQFFQDIESARTWLLNNE